MNMAIFILNYMTLYGLSKNFFNVKHKCLYASTSLLPIIRETIYVSEYSYSFNNSTKDRSSKVANISTQSLMFKSDCQDVNRREFQLFSYKCL